MSGAAFGLGPLGLPIGERIKGGCDDCRAYQRLEPERDGIYMLRIYHDDTCPVLARKRGRR